MERFVPDGYEPLEKAVLLVAQARSPSLWDGLHRVEDELYQRLGRSIHAEALHGLLVVRSEMQRLQTVPWLLHRNE